MPLVEQRRKSRITALQFLFGLEFRPFDGEEELKDFWKNNPNRKSVRNYAETLIQGVIEKQEEIDEIIKKSLKRWNWERVGHIERVIIKIATYEAGIATLVSPRIAISEAVELAKIFGTEDAPRFVNGVLDRVFCDQGWIEKDN
ncbi:MAG TPA: transcription antitermination factor NusB [Candidatus Hydrogenedens sp.]|nr:transcription antitermination factor NusB [Candidatus Hydrogenedens sp.]